MALWITAISKFVSLALTNRLSLTNAPICGIIDMCNGKHTAVSIQSLGPGWIVGFGAARQNPEEPFPICISPVVSNR